MAETLDEIGLKHGTDKASLHHDYLKMYERFLSPLRSLPITILEIGVYQGASLRTWREYFPRARVVGVDIQLSAKRYETDRIKVELADQSNVEHLALLAARHGPFDVVVEDGSHMWEHQITSLKGLFPFLKNGGYYIVEDLHTNYGPMQPQYRGVAAESCTNYLKRWMDLFVADDQLELADVEDAFLRTYGRAIDFMTFHRRACVIRKRYPTPDWGLSRGAPLAPRPPDSVFVGVSAHVGMRGDIYGPAGYVDEGEDLFTLQGFALESDGAALEYRVRYPDGTWSDWVGEGSFAGTRGISLAISGAAVRIGEAAAAKYEVSLRGLFVGGVTVDVEGGDDCVAATAADLRGLQVTVRPAAAAVEAAPETEPV